MSDVWSENLIWYFLLVSALTIYVTHVCDTCVYDTCVWYLCVTHACYTHVCDAFVWYTCVTHVCNTCVRGKNMIWYFLLVSALTMWRMCVTHVRHMFVTPMCHTCVLHMCVTHVCNTHVWHMWFAHMCDTCVWHICVTRMCDIYDVMSTIWPLNGSWVTYESRMRDHLIVFSFVTHVLFVDSCISWVHKIQGGKDS